VERAEFEIPTGDLGNNIIGLACGSTVQTTFMKTWGQVNWQQT